MKLSFRFVPMIAVMGMIFYMSHQPGDSFHLPDVCGIDKIIHFFTYGCLAAAFLYGLHPLAGRIGFALTSIVVILFSLLFGILDEFHQSFIPFRSVSIWDVVADGFGALLVVALWYWQKRHDGAKD